MFTACTFDGKIIQLTHQPVPFYRTEVVQQFFDSNCDTSDFKNFSGWYPRTSYFVGSSKQQRYATDCLFAIFSSCLHHLCPPPRDQSLISWIRTLKTSSLINIKKFNNCIKKNWTLNALAMTAWKEINSYVNGQSKHWAKFTLNSDLVHNDSDASASKPNDIYLSLLVRAHSFLRVKEFRAKPQNLFFFPQNFDISMEFH